MSHSPEAAIEFSHVSYRLGTDRALISDLNLSVRRGETLMLLGRSGSGKTTSLKLINRLLVPNDGAVLVDGVDTAAWDVIRLRRHIGYAIQDVGLFPHYTVEQNVALVPKLEAWAPDRISARVKEVLTLVGLPARGVCQALSEPALRRAEAARRPGSGARRGPPDSAHG